MKRSLPVLCALLVGGALAQASAPLRLTLSQDLVTTVTENGRSVEKLTPAPRTVQPGDTLTQSLSASNVGKAALKGAALNLPVPRGTTYAGGATPASARWVTQFSFDGGRTYAAAPLKKTISVVENGVAVRREVVVPPSEYTNVRWIVGDIKPDETLKLGFRVKVK